MTARGVPGETQPTSLLAAVIRHPGAMHDLLAAPDAPAIYQPLCDAERSLQAVSSTTTA